MQRDAVRFTADHQRRTEREASDLQDWLRRRADDICGAFVPQTGDLFGAITVGPDWRLLSAPLDRLAAFTADADNPPARRREANSVIELFQRRTREHAARAACRRRFCVRSACSCWCRRRRRVTLDLRDCAFSGPALPEPFVQLRTDRTTDQAGVAVQRPGQRLRAGLECAAAAVPLQRWSTECLQPCRRCRWPNAWASIVRRGRTTLRRAKAWRTAAG